MAVLNIDNPRAIELAKRIAEKTRETLDHVVVRSLEELAAREQPVEGPQFEDALYLELMELTAPPLPLADPRSADDILGYNEFGAF